MERITSTTQAGWTGNGHLQEAPTRQLLEEFRFEGARFARAELDLVREELKKEARVAGKGASMAGAGGAVVYVALFCLAGTCIALLSLALPVWAAALIVTVVFGGVGAALVAAGRNRLKTVRPERTINEFKEDARWLRRTTHDIKASRHASA